MQQHIIMLAGFKRSGKDTVGQILLDEGYKRVAFADAIKQEAANVITQAANTLGLPVPGRHMTDEAMKDDCMPNFGKSFRDVVDNIGMNRRKFDPHYWTRQVIQFCQNHEKVVITDARLFNEYEAVQATGLPVSTWWISRPGIQANPDIPTETDVLKRVSETVIENDSDFDTLTRRVKAALMLAQAKVVREALA